MILDMVKKSVCSCLVIYEGNKQSKNYPFLSLKRGYPSPASSLLFSLSCTNLFMSIKQPYNFLISNASLCSIYIISENEKIYSKIMLICKT